MQMVVASFGD